MMQIWLLAIALEGVISGYTTSLSLVYTRAASSWSVSRTLAISRVGHRISARPGISLGVVRTEVGYDQFNCELDTEEEVDYLLRG